MLLKCICIQIFLNSKFLPLHKTDFEKKILKFCQPNNSGNI
jgi:hypothetical protein